MKIRRSTAVAGLAAVAAAVGLVLAGAPAAFAATPTYEPDTNSYGTLAFFDASGNQVTTGTITNAPMAAYVVGTKPGRTGDTTTLLNMAQPNPNAATGLWNKDTLTGATTYPLPATGNPANIVALSQNHAVSKGTTGDFTVANFIAEFPNTGPTGAGCAYSPGNPSGCTNTAYQNLYQLRLITANGANQNPQYQVADILVSGNTWTQVFGATVTSTTLTASPSPTDTATSVTLTATETPAVAGSVQFVDGTTNIGTPVAVNASGVATTTNTFGTTGTHNLSAVFTPTDTVNNFGSTGTTTETVTAPLTPTSTALAVTQDGFAGDPVTLSATVTPSTATGSVLFYDNGSTTAIPGTVTQSSNTYTLSLPAGLAAGGHSIVAKFTATGGFANSQSAAQSFVLQNHPTGACAQTGSVCTDQQTIQVTVPVGTLVISTPYTATNPLNVGTMGLTTNATMLTANAPFNNIIVTDGRSGDLPYTVQALCSALTATGSNAINGENVGLTGMTSAGSGGYAGTTTLTNISAASPPVQPSDTGSLGLGGATAHTIIQSSAGLGTLTVNGMLTINAPTNTSPGLYTGTITFTVG